MWNVWLSFHKYQSSLLWGCKMQRGAYTWQPLWEVWPWSRCRHFSGVTDCPALGATEGDSELSEPAAATSSCCQCSVSAQRFDSPEHIDSPGYTWPVWWTAVGTCQCLCPLFRNLSLALNMYNNLFVAGWMFWSASPCGGWSGGPLWGLDGRDGIAASLFRHLDAVWQTHTQTHTSHAGAHAHSQAHKHTNRKMDIIIVIFRMTQYVFKMPFWCGERANFNEKPQNTWPL